MDREDWSNQFESLFKTPLGQELLRTLKEDLHASIIEDAEAAQTQESAFGLLKEASGVIKALEHLRFRSVVPRDEESSK